MILSLYNYMEERCEYMEKAHRVLLLFYRLLKGERIHKANFAFEHHVTERSVERDIQTIRNCLEEQHANMSLLFDRKNESYYLSIPKHGFSYSSQVKILRHLKETEHSKTKT